MTGLSFPNLYVYYRVHASREADALRSIADFLVQLDRAGTGRPRLMRRPDVDAAGRQTWMEVYEPWDEAWTSDIKRCFDRCGMTALVDGERHVEVFVDLALHRGQA